MTMQTASLGLVTGTHLELPEHPMEHSKTGEWVIILGGTSGVGQYSIQVYDSMSELQFIVDKIPRLLSLMAIKSSPPAPHLIIRSLMPLPLVQYLDLSDINMTAS